MNDNIQEVLTFDQCREEIIKLGKFEFRDNRYICHYNALSKVFNTNTSLKLSCILNIKNLPEDISNQEIIYHILWNHTEYLDPKCSICSKRLKFKRINIGYQKHCSLKCRNHDENFHKKKAETYKKKTGYDNPSQNPEVVNRKKKNSLEKYGTAWPLGNKEIQEKRRQTCYDNTGYREPLANPELREKYDNERFERTGYYHNMQDPEGLKYWQSCYEAKTGYTNPNKVKEVREKLEQTCMERYGVKYVISIMQDKSKKTKLERYGDSGYHNVDKMKQTNLERYGHTSNLALISKYSKVSQKLFDVIYENLSDALKFECYYATCKTNNHNKEFVKMDKDHDTSYFYDFVLSHLKLVIEFDGDYWHSKPEVKARDIQKQKFIEDLGFKVIRIKECDYYEDKQKIVSYCLSEIYNYLEAIN